MPSRYLTDYYGLHVLQPVAKTTVLNDFATDAKVVVEKGNGEVKLHFHDDYLITFYFEKDLVLGTKVIDTKHSYAWFEVENVDELIYGLQSFWALLKTKKLKEKYLIANKYYQLEFRIAAQMQSNTPAVKLVSDNNLQKFRSSNNAVLIVQDYVHGDIERYRKLINILEKEPVDWFGIEMYGRNVQTAIDKFLQEDKESEKWQQARQHIIQNSWKQKFADEDPNNPYENRYYKLLELCKTKSIAVYAMESDSKDYVLWGHGETPFGGAVRNLVWVQALPKRGKGVIFGGSAHFQNYINSNANTNVQDFLFAVNKDREILDYGR